MKIEIINGHVCGQLEFKLGVYDLLNVLYHPTKPLYNFEWDALTDSVLDSVIVYMRGSIISMMQFRKFVLMNWPYALKNEARQ